jgi:hypothetical protein
VAALKAENRTTRDELAAAREERDDIGGYGYYGEYTDWSQEIRVAITDDCTALDPTADPALTTATITKENYMELIGAADIEASFKGGTACRGVCLAKSGLQDPPQISGEAIRVSGQ